MSRRHSPNALPEAFVNFTAQVAPSKETPIALLFRDWRQAMRHEKATYLGAGEFWEAPICAEATERVLAIERKILATPASGPLDWLMKFWAVTEGGDFAMTGAKDPALWAEAGTMVGAEAGTMAKEI